jgi:hypothetical protein
VHQLEEFLGAIVATETRRGQYNDPVTNVAMRLSVVILRCIIENGFYRIWVEVRDAHNGVYAYPRFVCRISQEKDDPIGSFDGLLFEQFPPFFHVEAREECDCFRGQ